MRDHLRRAPRRQVTRKSVGVRELKTHAAHIVREIRESHTSYLVTHRGRAVGVLLPLDAVGDTSQVLGTVDDSTAWETFVRLGHQLERGFRPGATGVRLLSEMRR